MSGSPQCEHGGIDPSPGTTSEHDTAYPLLSRRVDGRPEADAVYATTLSLLQHSWLADHRVGKHVIMPGAAVAELVRGATESYLGGAPIVRGLVFRTPMILHKSRALPVQVVIGSLGTRASVYSQSIDAADSSWTLHAAARFAPQVSTTLDRVDIDGVRSRCSRLIDAVDLYEHFAALGLNYGPQFRGVRALVGGGDEALGEICLADGADIRGYGMHPVLLDAAMHVAAAVNPAGDGIPRVPLEVGRFVLHRSAGHEALVHARLSGEGERSAARVVDITIADCAGMPIAELSALRFWQAEGLMAPSP